MKEEGTFLTDVINKNSTEFVSLVGKLLLAGIGDKRIDPDLIHGHVKVLLCA